MVLVCSAASAFVMAKAAAAQASVSTCSSVSGSAVWHSLLLEPFTWCVKAAFWTADAMWLGAVVARLLWDMELWGFCEFILVGKSILVSVLEVDSFCRATSFAFNSASRTLWAAAFSGRVG